MTHADADAGAPGPAGPARVVLVGRAGCHLCEEAREVVETVTAAAGERWVQVSVDDDPDLLRRYGELVPVVLVDGARLAVHRVRGEDLRAALRRDDGRPAWLRRWWRGG